MQCIRCGTTAADGSRFCAKCGGQLSDPGAATTRISAANAAVDPLLATLREALAGEYEIEKELGRGGMAIVFKATETALGRAVALKVLPPEMAVTPSIAERFKREARMAASMSHPNIIDVYRVGQAGGISYIAMRYIEGRPLEDVIESQGALPIPALLIVLRSSVSALAYAHERGIIHRDIKGGNILLDRDGRVTVSDFGIARAIEEAGLTQSGAVIGTPYFMAPEQCAGLPLGPQCDQYAMGVVAFQMLTGEVPFKAESVIGIMHHHFSTPVPDVNTVRAGVPMQLLGVVERALAKKAEDRYATTYEMLEAVEAIPQTEQERREGEQLLRHLARGGEMKDRVPTGKVTTPPPSYPGLASAAPSRSQQSQQSQQSQPATPPASRAATPPMPNPAVTPPSAPSVTPHPDARWAPPPAGQPQPPYAQQQPYGQPGYPPPYATPQQGQPPYGQPPYAQPPHGQPPYGHSPYATAGSQIPPVAAGASRGSGAGRWIAIAAVLLLLVVGAGVVWRQRTSPETRMRRATELYTAGRTDAARARFERIARDNPRMVEPHLYLARIARERRDMTGARLELERALELDPRNATALREMGSVLFAEGNFELARRFYVRALQVAPEDRLAQGFLGCSLVRLGRAAEGERFIQRAGRGPWDGCAP